jgi:DNA-binding transcriptional LysR family regulator
VISKMLARLGVQPLPRTTRTMQLTDIGTVYYERVCNNE